MPDELRQVAGKLNRSIQTMNHSTSLQYPHTEQDSFERRGIVSGGIRLSMILAVILMPSLTQALQ
jgi:hypothetical protein